MSTNDEINALHEAMKSTDRFVRERAIREFREAADTRLRKSVLELELCMKTAKEDLERSRNRMSPVGLFRDFF